MKNFIDKESIASKLNSLLQEHKTASIQVAIIKDGKTVLNEAYGYRDVENKITVDSDTIYPIASSTKAFTGVAIAKLVEEGKLEWDKSVKSYLPNFKMYDKYVTEELTVRDILCHRCGLPRHDFVWFMNNYSAEELIKKIKYLKPSAPFRQTLQYQNIMYALAGYLIETVTGKRWFEYIDEVIIKQLGMNNTYVSAEDAKKEDNRALPYDSTSGELKQIPNYYFTSDSTLGAAGSIVSNAQNILKWIDFNLNKGKYQGNQLVAEKEMKECHTPQMINKTMLQTNFKEIDFQSYGFGWFIESFKGHKLLHHGGNINGFSSMVAFIPSLNAGFCFLTNTGRTRLQTLLLYAFVDLLLGNNNFDEWNKKVKQYLKEMEDKANKVKEDFLSKCVSGTVQPFENKAYLGQYSNEAYGVIEITENDSQIGFKTPMSIIPMKHLCLNTFLAKGEVSGVEIFVPIEFKTNITGQLIGAVIDLEPALKEGIEFIKL